MIRLSDERGSGSVLAVGVGGAVIVTTLSTILALGALVAHQRVMNAADAAALAGADAASGAIAGEPCALAGRAAEANGAVVLACSSDGAVVSVTAGTSWAGIPLSARSRAGPPPER